MRALLVALLPWIVTPALAGELAGVTLPDTATVGGTTLSLNGMGLREFLFLDIYVGGLYLPAKSADAAAILAADVPKRVVMSFIFRKLSRDKVLETFHEGFENQGATERLAAQRAQLDAMLDRDLVSGDTVTLDYVPGKGTTLLLNGKEKGTIAGKDTMLVIWSIFLGDKPASTKLKQGLLGQ